MLKFLLDHFVLLMPLNLQVNKRVTVQARVIVPGFQEELKSPRDNGIIEGDI